MVVVANQDLRCCPVCGSGGDDAEIFLSKNIDDEKISNFSFASRKEPEFMCHHLVRCKGCDLVYANQPPAQSALAQAYHEANFDSEAEANLAAEAYDEAMKDLYKKIINKEAVLEIGTGTGVYLEYAKRRGFQSLHGVEPSPAAISAAPSYRRAWIRQDIFREKDYLPQSFDLICCFMTLEHVRDPNEIVAAAARLLRPGGAIALVTHSYRAPINKLLGKKSPIIDIEHMQLFSPRSIKRLLDINGFREISVKSFYNKYKILYWIRLLPLNPELKNKISNWLIKIGLGGLVLKLNVGNMLTYGQIPSK